MFTRIVGANVGTSFNSLTSCPAVLTEDILLSSLKPQLTNVMTALYS
jgi:hypothetical protein